jgi:hypothetical protein
MNHQRTSCVTLVTTLLVALVSMLIATAASASPFLYDQAHISAITRSTCQAVLPDQPILARAGRQRAPTYDESETGARLADGDKVTRGAAQVLRTPYGGRSHAYDLATNNAAAPWSQPSQATAQDSREPIGSTSVDKAASSVVALSVAAEGGAGAFAEEQLPPGYAPDTWTTGPAGRNIPEEHFYDPEGGEWRWHPPDSWHSEGHWDYKPGSPWNAPWQHWYQNPDGTWGPR